MTARLPFAALLLALLCLLPQTALGQGQPRTPSSVQTLRSIARAQVQAADTSATFRTRTVRRDAARGRFDVEAGVLRALYRIGETDVPGGEPEEAARTYLASQAEAFGLDSGLSDLQTQRVQRGPRSAHVHFQQTFAGLPVYGRQVTVNLDRAGRPSMVLSGYAPHLAGINGFDARPAFSAAEARSRAEALLDGPARASEPELVVYPSEDPRLAWRLLAWPEGAPAEWEILLDARTGAPIHLRDQTTHRGGFGKGGERERGGMGEWTKGGGEEGRGKREGGSEEWRNGGMEEGRESGDHALHLSPFTFHPSPFTRVDGTGLVFDPDPLTTSGQPYEAPFVDADDADVPELNAQRREVPLREIAQGSDGRYRLEGPYVQITGSASVGGSAYEPPAEASPDGFRYGRADDAFEAVMAYYHVDKSQRYLQTLDLGRPIQAQPIRVNPHGLGDFDDSKFYPGQNAIALGTGGIDDAEDASVIWHEYAHALLEYSAPGLLSTTEGQALHEGWADYWAASYARGLVENGDVPAGDWRHLFSWDGNNGCWQGRTLEHDGHYPDDVDIPAEPGCGQMGFIYQLGVLWATTLMEVYDDLGRDVTDRLNLYSHAYLSAPVAMQDAAEALLQADQDLYDGAHQDVLIARLGARGFIDPDVYGPDSEPPEIRHRPLARAVLAGWPASLFAEASDRSGVADVWVTYTVETAGGAKRTEGRFSLEGADVRYQGTFPIPADELQEGDVVRYRVHARDGSEAANEAVLPVSGMFEAKVVSEGALVLYDFESSLTDVWKADGDWGRAAPAYGLQVARSGNRVWATAPEAAYRRTSGLARLEVPSVDLSGTNAAYLVFWHWYDTAHDDGAEDRLRDGGQVQVSTDGGASWALLEPEGGYPGAIQEGSGNPLGGQPGIGGFSYGWQRVTVPLPQDPDVRLRFAFGTDAGGEGVSRYGQAGWYLDDVRITTEYPEDDAPPEARLLPQPVLVQGNREALPTISAQFDDNAGVAHVLAEYEAVLAGGTTKGTLRLAMSETDLTTFSGTITLPTELLPGDEITYRLRVRDVAGNAVQFPREGEAPFRISYRNIRQANALGAAGIRASGLWQSQGTAWTATPGAGTAARSALVLEPIDLPINADGMRFVLKHRYHLGDGLGGNVKISVDGGAWQVIEPEEAYAAIFEETETPMTGEPILRGTRDNATSTFDLAPYAGAQVRLRVDLGAGRPLAPDEFWTLQEASVFLSTAAPDGFETPRELALHPNFPNPFSASTTITYTLPQATDVRLEVYDLLGRRVAVLAEGEQAAATHTVTFDGSGLASGVYLLRLWAGGTQRTMRVVVAR